MGGGKLEHPVGGLAGERSRADFLTGESSKQLKTCKIYSFNLNYSDYINIETNVSHELISSLCDTPADISAIEQSAIKIPVELDTSEQIRIKGVTDDFIESIGTIFLQIRFDKCIIQHIFHVVPDSFNILSDAIIGKDFNRRFNCKIDYKDMSFTVRAEDYKIKIKIHSEPRENTVALPAW